MSELHMLNQAAWEECVAVKTERDALRAVNADLLAALVKAHSALRFCETVYGSDWPKGASIRDDIKEVGATIARAKGGN